MATINQLSQIGQLQLSDLLPVYSAANSDARKASITQLFELLQDNLVAHDDKLTQYSAPSSTGFTVNVQSEGSTWLVLTPAGAFANGTIVLPEVAGVQDRQELLVSCTQAVTTLAVSGNGATVTGAPTTLAANAFFRLRFDLPSQVWYRVG
jgi:archaellum component FlaF (FlaF/FlaG flagellin family)